MRKLLVASVLALAVAGVIVLRATAGSYEDTLIRVQVQELLPELAAELRDESAELQALFLDYADDAVLIVQARLALLRHPEAARSVLALYGDDPQFQAVLKEFGPAVLPPIRYFLDHEVRTLVVLRYAQESWQALREVSVRLGWPRQDAEEGVPERSGGELTAQERGRYAVHFIATEGHGFLGQFVVTDSGTVRWIQTERGLEAVNNFFAGGLRSLEIKYRLEQEIGMADVGWAGLDVAIGLGTLKVLRLARPGAATARGVGFSQRTAAMSSRLLRSGRFSMRVARFGAPAVVVYLAVRHPAVFDAMLGRLAETLGVPAGLVRFIGWSLLLLPVVYLGLWLLKALLPPLRVLLVGVQGLLAWLERPRRALPAAAGSGASG